jgi:hypothetical protein
MTSGGDISLPEINIARYIEQSNKDWREKLQGNKSNEYTYSPEGLRRISTNWQSQKASTLCRPKNHQGADVRCAQLL